MNEDGTVIDEDFINKMVADIMSMQYGLSGGPDPQVAEDTEESRIKKKLQGYITKADSIERMSDICEKFLQKYRPHVFNSHMSPVKYVQVPANGKILKSSMAILENPLSQSPAYMDQARRNLVEGLVDQLLDSNKVHFSEYKDPISYSKIIEARVGVYKP